MILPLKLCYFKSYRKSSTNYCYCTGRQAYRSANKSNWNIVKEGSFPKLGKSIGNSYWGLRWFRTGNAQRGQGGVFWEVAGYQVGSTRKSSKFSFPWDYILHNVCVCTYHQNPKLMMSNSLMTSTLEFRRVLGNGVDVILINQHVLSLMMCNPPQQECWLNNYWECQDVSSLFENISGIFSDLDIDEVTYKQWQSTDRTELATIIESRTDFVQSLCSKLTLLKTHQFIHSMQSTFYQNLKAELPEGQVLVVGNFLKLFIHHSRCSTGSPLV